MNLFETLGEMLRPEQNNDVLNAAKKANAYGCPFFTGEKHDAFNEGFIEGAKWDNDKIIESQLCKP